MKRCNKLCPACPYIQECKVINDTKFIWKIRNNLNCESTNVVYMIECQLQHCKQRYIGETTYLKRRIMEHVGYVKSEMLSKATGSHFNLPGHNVSHLWVTVLEKVKKNDTIYRKGR